MTTMEAIPDLLTPKDVRIFGSAPALQYAQISEALPRRYVLVFGKGDDVIAGLYHVAEEERLISANFSAIGALQQTALAFFDRHEKVYKTIYLREQSELVSLTGNICLKDGKYAVHVHAAVSLVDGRTIGGHLLYTNVWPTVELFLTESEETLERQKDDESDLWLIKP